MDTVLSNDWLVFMENEMTLNTAELEATSAVTCLQMFSETLQWHFK